MYQRSRNKIVQVFLVLNSNAIFIYKDRKHYESLWLDHPKGIILFSQLNSIVSRNMDAKGIFRDFEAA